MYKFGKDVTLTDKNVYFFDTVRKQKHTSIKVEILEILNVEKGMYRFH